jgi:hypothetical protein
LPSKLSDTSFFPTNVAAVVAKKTEKDKTLGAESQRHWGEICTGRFQFDRVEREVTALKALDANHLLAFIDRYISMTPVEGESQRAKLSIQYFGNKVAALPDVVLRETEERVAFANKPLPAEAPAAGAVLADGSSPSAVVAEVASASPPAAAVASVVADVMQLASVPVDPRPIEMLDDLVAF